MIFKISIEFCLKTFIKREIVMLIKRILRSNNRDLFEKIKLFYYLFIDK